MSINQWMNLADAMDQQDPLRAMRDEFVIPSGVVYLDGNSLGALPSNAVLAARNTVERHWGERLIRGWNEGWWQAPTRLGDKIGALIGAEQGEVLVTDNTSVNLFKLASAVLNNSRRTGPIVTDDQNFPSDLYILRQVAKNTGREVRTVATDGVHVSPGSLDAGLQGASLLALSLVAFRSGAFYDGAQTTAAAHRHGVPVLWDLSHAAGAVPVDLSAWNADLAVGCTYKYLNGGPGAPAFLFVRKDLIPMLDNPLPGWMGHANPFEMASEYESEPTIRRFMTGSPPILSLAAIEAGIDAVSRAGMAAIRAKSVAMTELIIRYFTEELRPFGFSLASPVAPAERGSHVTLAHAEALPISRCLVRAHGVIPDFRPPNGLRLGVAPLYNSFRDVCLGLEAVRKVVESREYVAYASDDGPVT